MSLKHAGQLMLLTILSFVSFTQTVRAQDLTVQPDDSQIWRSSLDGKFYTVTNSNGVHIKAIYSGRIVAEVQPLTDKKGRLKTDRKGNDKLEGRWGFSNDGGLIVIEEMDASRIHGFLLAPTAGNQAFACNSRKAAVIWSMGQPGPVCTRLEVTWELQPGMSLAQAAAAETQAVFQQANFAVAAPSGQGSSDPQLVGTWFKQVFDGNAGYSTTLELRSDGTYTKYLIGTPHSGTWTSSGRSVHLSGDGHSPPTDENMSLFRKRS